MRKYLIYCLAVLCVGFMASCETEDPIAESTTLDITLLGTTPSGGKFDDQTASLGVSLKFISTDKDLKKLIVTKNGETLHEADLTLNEDKLNALNVGSFVRTNDKQITYSFENVLTNIEVNNLKDEDEIVYTFAILDKEGRKEVAVPFTFEGEEEELLSTATAFSFQRVAGNPATGLDMFGLSWTENTVTNAIVVKATNGATKLVNLTGTDWDITTQTALEVAIDGATAITEYTGVSVSANKNDYTDVIGVKNGDDYYIIKVLSSTVVSDGSGTTITVQAEYKTTDIED